MKLPLPPGSRTSEIRRGVESPAFAGCRDSYVIVHVDPSGLRHRRCAGGGKEYIGVAGKVRCLCF